MTQTDPAAGSGSGKKGTACRMKNPLRYQMSEYDCGPTAILDALIYLFDREELPPGVIKIIYMLTMAKVNCKGIPGRGGTSNNAVHFVADWFNDYRATTGFPISCSFLKGPSVSFHKTSKLRKQLQHDNAVAVLRVSYGCDHYVLVTHADEKYAYIFDPYYEENPVCVRDGNSHGKIIDVKDHPKEYNRMVEFSVLDSEVRGTYSLINSEGKCAAIFYKAGDSDKLTPEVDEQQILIRKFRKKNG